MPVQIRFRYAYPAADIMTENPSFDRALDDALARVRGHHIGQPDLRSSVVVMGFPRSANTFLTFWLKRHVRDGVTVLDGRATHSALDVSRHAEAGAKVILAVREPIETAASFMVRGGTPNSSKVACRALRAYAAWYRVAAKSLDAGDIVVMPFRTAISEPESLVKIPGIARLLGEGAGAHSDDLVNELRDELKGEPGQGESEGGVPSAWMISVPNEARAQALVTATSVIRGPLLVRERRAAERAYAGLLEAATQRSLVITGGMTTERVAPIRGSSDAA